MSVPLKDNVYQVLRERLFTGRFRPGSRVSELALAKELGMSRTPVREALNQLISEGVLEQVPNAGVFVKKPDRGDLEDLYQLREWLETHAAAEAARRITPPELAELEQSCHVLRELADRCRHLGADRAEEVLLPRRVTADFAFHTTLIRASGNRRVMKVVADHHVLSQLWGALPEPQTLANLAQLYKEHTRILRAVRRRDPDAAWEFMRHHLQVARDKVLARYDWEQRRLAAGRMLESSFPESMRRLVQRMETEQASRAAARQEVS